MTMRPTRTALTLSCDLARYFQLGALIGSLICAHAQSQTPAPRVSAVTNYSGSADASGAVSLGTNFFVVGDDEDDTLRVYRRHGGGDPVASVCLTNWENLYVPGVKKKELDLEAAARLGDKVFWLGSHSNNKEGKIAPDRRQLFATTITETNGEFHITLAGRPYRNLIADFAEDPRLRDFELAEAAAKGTAPKSAGGLNLEGLCATPDGHLLLGFRNPIPHGRALLVPLLNPEGVLVNERARLGDPILLDLQGRGIRDLILVGDEYFIIGGDYRSEHKRSALVSQLYQWAGGSALPRRVAGFPELNPEVLIAYPDTGRTELQILSDDGQKPPLPPAQRKFRSVLVNF
jgi:hypothetical protein